MRRLRVGRKVGRTIYEQRGAEPDDRDVLVGVMDTRELAREVVNAVNAARAVASKKRQPRTD